VHVLTYTLTRLGIFGGCVLVLWRSGLGGWLLVAIAAVAAWAISYLTLPRQRAAAIRELAERDRQRQAAGRRFTAGIDADAAAEDAAAPSPDRG
jgi:drug/metabolite transporter (DMT)-like permease